ncbi:MAG: glycosyltransferase family 39 protein [Ignavibacteria bacterium]|nr:glycosyltransferase family 39 protein [Ignavibacteria bacterium]MBT8390164.1 glycosyltransferase family 39 protein [Ignavibacteria bacterium]NNL20343.1 hypothetical protein [Ignavibacteriaceae bacterium]
MAKSKIKKRKSSGEQKPSSSKSLMKYFDELVNYKRLSLIISLFYLLVIGIISIVFHTVGDYGIETDFFWGYVPNARGFLEGAIPMDAFRGPLYPMVLGIVGFLFGDFFRAGILIGVISAAIVIYVTFEILKRVFSPYSAFFVTILLAFNPVFVQYTYSAGTDMFFNALAALTIFFFLRNSNLTYGNIVFAGVFGGLSYLTRYNGVFLLSFIIVILFVNFWNLPWKKRFVTSAIFICVFVLTFSPWGFYTLSEKGSFLYNENYKNIAYEMHGKGKIAWDEFWFKESSKITSLTDVVFEDPAVFVSKVAGNIGNHFLNDMEKLMGWHIGVFVILGLIFLFIRNPIKFWKSVEIGYYLISLFFFGLLLLVFYSERFSLFLIPFYAVIAFHPFFSEKYKVRKFVPQKFGLLLVSALIIFTFVKSYSFNSLNIDSGPKELLVLQEWYDKNIPEEERGEKIAARKAHVAYYLDMEFKLIPMAENYNEFIVKLREQKADFLYFSTIEAAMRRQFQFLLNPKQNHPGLEAVVYFESPPAVLYKVLQIN